MFARIKLFPDQNRITCKNITELQMTHIYRDNQMQRCARPKKNKLVFTIGIKYLENK